jgi:hypothetical protein
MFVKTLETQFIYQKKADILIIYYKQDQQGKATFNERNPH